MIKRLLLITVGLAALVLNPFFGCGDDPPDFTYGADEMRAAVEGTWKLTAPATANQPARELVFSISQAAGHTERHSRRGGLVTEAAACAQRSLVKPASACIDTSEMPLDVVLLADGAKDTGMFQVVGLRFTSGRLQLELGPASASAEVTPSGDVSNVRWDGEAATMVRVSIARH